MSEKVKENSADMTEGSILRKLILFAVPVLLGNVLQELYMMADTLIVGRTLGVSKLAAIGSCSALIFIVIGFLLGMSGGCSVLTSNSYGAKDEKALKKSIAAHILISAAATVILTSCSTYLSGKLLTLLNTSGEIFAYSKVYLIIMYAGIPAGILYNLCASSLRAVGNSRTPLHFLIFSSFLNIGLDLVFILWCGLDVAGAALATVISQLVSGILCLIFIKYKFPMLIPDRDCWSDLKESILFELKVGIPMGIQFSLIAAGFIALQYVLNSFGHEAVAAFTIGGRIQSLMMNPLASAAVVMATFSGQNFGAGKFERIKEGALKIIIFTIASAMLGGAVIWFSCEYIISFFISADETVTILLAKDFFNWSCPLIWILSFVFVYRGVLQGIGDGVTPMLGAVLEFIMRTFIPLLLSARFGFDAVCAAGPAAWFACGLLTFSVYCWRINKLIRSRRSAPSPEPAA